MYMYMCDVCVIMFCHCPTQAADAGRDKTHAEVVRARRSEEDQRWRHNGAELTRVAEACRKYRHTARILYASTHNTTHNHAQTYSTRTL